MKVSEIIGDDNERKIIHLVNHIKKKKKANPKANKTGPMKNFLDVFGGMAGYNAGDDITSDFIS